MAVEVSPVVAEVAIIELARMRRDLAQYVAAARKVVAETRVTPGPHAQGDMACLYTLRWIADDLDRIGHTLSPASLSLLREERRSDLTLASPTVAPASWPRPKCPKCGHSAKSHRPSTGVCVSCLRRLHPSNPGVSAPCQ